MKKIIILSALCASVLAVAIPAYIALAAETGLTDLKTKASRECSTYTTKLNDLKNKLAEDSTSFNNLKKEIDINGSKLPALKSTLAATIDALIQNKILICTVIAGADTLAEYNTNYDSLKVIKTKIDAAGNISKLDSYYGQYQELSDNYNKIGSFVMIGGLFYNYLNGSTLDNEKKYLIDRKNRIEDKLTNLVTINNLNDIIKSPNNVSLGQLIYRLNSGKSEMNTLTAEYRRNAVPAMINVMTAAAQDGINFGAGAPEEYKELYDYYSAKTVSEKTSLSRKLESDKKILASYDVKLNTTDALQYLEGSTPNTLMVDYIKERPDWFINDAASPIKTIGASLGSAATYAAVITQKNAYGAIMIGEYWIKNFQLSLDFVKSHKKAKEYRDTCLRFASATPLLRSGLGSDDQKSLDAVAAGISDACTVVTTQLSNPDNNPGDFKTIQGKISYNTSRDVDKINKDDVDALSTLIKNYNNKLSDAGKIISAQRREWWKLIEKAVIEGKPAFKAGYAASALANEKKAADLTASYDKKRQSYRDSTQRLITSRKATLEKNRIAMFSYDNQLAAFPWPLGSTEKTLKVAFTDKLNILLGNATTEGSLDYYYANTIDKADNYNDLKEAVKNIKSEFLLSEVVIPLQKSYVQFNDLESDLSKLSGVSELLKQRIDSIPANKDISDLYNTIMADMIKLLGEEIVINNEIRDLISNVDATDQSAIKDSLQPKITSAKKLISQIASEERALQALIKKAE